MLHDWEIKKEAEGIACGVWELCGSENIEILVVAAIRRAFVNDGEYVVNKALSYALAWLNEVEGGGEDE